MTVRSGRAFEPQSMELGGGISSLAAVAVISGAATVILIATTAAGVSWSDNWFRLLAALLAAAVIIAQARGFSSRRAAFALGVVCASLPSLVIARTASDQSLGRLLVLAAERALHLEVR